MGAACGQHLPGFGNNQGVAVRDKRYKLIYWYNEDFGIPGARSDTTEEKEWELFECEKDNPT